MNPTTRAILDLLKSQDGWVSGQEIGRGLGVSRCAISKHIGLLRSQGYSIESVPRRGHRLRSSVDLPHEAEVEPLLETRWIGRRIVYLDEVDSTNSEAARQARAGCAEGLVVVADAQTAGRGRLHRQWVSPPGVNLYFSVVLRPRVAPTKIMQLSLVTGVAVHQALRDVAATLDVRIKWPNDLLIGGRKLCGILCESEIEADLVHQLVVGVGVNVNGRSFPLPLGETATSLRMETGDLASRPALLARVLNRFEQLYEIWCRAGDLEPFLPELNRHSFLVGHRVSIEGPGCTFDGVSETITSDGALVVRLDSGQRRMVATGDVHVVSSQGDGV